MAENGSDKSSPKYYDAATVRKSLGHFLLGKGFAAVAAFLVLFLLVRELDVNEFAAYTSLHALALIIGLISSVGIPPTLHRFLPEFRTHHNNRAMYRMLIGGIVLRGLAYALMGLLLLLLLKPITAAFKLEDWYALVPWYFLVGFLRVNATFMSQALENLLWQRDSQYSLAAGGLVKLAGTYYVISTGTLTLETFISVEIVSEASSLLMLMLFTTSRWFGDSARHEGDAGVLIANRARYLRFALWSYMQNITSVFYGSAPNRLFVAYFMSAESIALFGVIDRLIDFARRYEPLHMFIGLVRPVLMSRYSENENFPRLAQLANLILFANFVILAAPLVVLLVAGDWFLAWLTSGKYLDIALLLSAFYAVLLITSGSNLVDMLVKAVEHNRIYMFSNMVLSGSLLIAIPLIPALGLWSVAIANAAGVIASLSIVIWYLDTKGYRYRFAWRHSAPILAACVISVAVGTALNLAGVHPLVTATIASLCYLGLMVWMLPLGDDERAKLLEIIPARLQRFMSRGAKA